MTKKQIMAEIESEISGYDMKKSVANAMRKLGELGFRFSGHGSGYGVEHFGLIKGQFYFSIEDSIDGTKGVITWDTGSDEDGIEVIFTGTLRKALNFVKKMKT